MTTPEPLRSGLVADPVHGYVDITGIEKLILDHPVAQRLRYVSQTGLAYLVYPEARTSRFIHSLGAMHLASRFLSASLRNADRETRHAVGEAVRTAVRQTLGAITGNIDRVVSGLAWDVLTARSHCEPDHARFFLVAEQALRLAALFHDLGHLPFSHDFEHALGDHWGGLTDEEKERSLLLPAMRGQAGEAALHERLGHGLSFVLLRELFRDLEERPEGHAARACFELAQSILTATYLPGPPASPVEAAFRWLHELVDGEIDVDRCDYILRDGRNFGFGVAAYDLSRLVDNLVVAQADQRFTLAIRPQGMSAVESFLLARFRIYEYGVWHHKVVQVSAALWHAIKMIVASPQDPTVRAFLADLGTIAQAEDDADDNDDPSAAAELLARFARYDDVWWMGVLRQQAGLVSDEWLDLVCWRKRGPLSLWKRRGDFPRPDLREWNEQLPPDDDKVAQAAWHDAVASLERDGILVAKHRFNPLRLDPRTGDSRLQVREPNGQLSPISTRSSLVRSLRTLWAEAVQVHAFARSDRVVAAEAVISRLPMIARSSTE